MGITGTKEGKISITPETAEDAPTTTGPIKVPDGKIVVNVYDEAPNVVVITGKVKARNIQRVRRDLVKAYRRRKLELIKEGGK